MKPLILFLVLTFVSSVPATADTELDVAVQDIESQWAITHYQLKGQVRARKFKELLTRSQELVSKYPEQAEPLIWKAIVLCTYAGEVFGIESLSTIEAARDLLLKAIDLDKAALDGSAYVTLGSLYYMVPGWPIAFGDTDQAKQYLEYALNMNPDGIDSNYFYGDFLLRQGRYQESIKFLSKALNAPIRPNQMLADSKLKEDVRRDLRKAINNQNGNLTTLIESFFGFQPKPGDRN